MGVRECCSCPALLFMHVMLPHRFRLAVLCDSDVAGRKNWFKSIDRARQNLDGSQARGSHGTIPIIMASVYDPVEVGLINSLAALVATLQGSQMSPDLAGKRLELLKDILPKLSRAAILWRPGGGASSLSWKTVSLCTGVASPTPFHGRTKS